MSKDGNVRLCCRKATFFGMPIPAGGGRENNPSAPSAFEPANSVDIHRQNSVDKGTLSAVIEAKKEP
jgi:hypothetical protein